MNETSEAGTATVPNATAATQPSASRLERLFDRLNPILVRDIQQSLRRATFATTVGLALAAMQCAVFMTIQDSATSRELGGELMSVALMVFSPIALLLIPLQAHTSMVREVRGDAGEQLMLTRLRPWRIVFGKLAAAMVQFAVYASTFGPLLAMTFLMRGVDVPTILFFFALGTGVCLCASAACIATGAISRLQIVSGLLFSGVAIGLSMATVGSFTALRVLPMFVPSMLAQPEFPGQLLVAVTLATLGVLLVCMVSASMLTHPVENRSTQFRVFLVLSPLIGYALVLLDPLGISATTWQRRAPTLCAMTASIVCGIGWILALTEEERLSPRIRTLVPRSRVAAFLAAPFLPGSGRGMTFVALNALTIFGPMFALREHYGLRPLSIGGRAAIGVAAYMLIYAFIGRQIRRLFRTGVPNNWRARGTLLGLALLCTLLAALYFALTDTPVSDWSVVWILAPHATLAKLSDNQHHETILTILLSGVGFSLLASIPAMIRGQSEVLAAAGARRERERTGNTRYWTPAAAGPTSAPQDAADRDAADRDAADRGAADRDTANPTIPTEPA